MNKIGEVPSSEKGAYGKQINEIKQSIATMIQEKADVISLHLPLNALTNYYANEAFFKGLQKKPYFISTCRGAVTDANALLKALQNQQINIWQASPLYMGLLGSKLETYIKEQPSWIPARDLQRAKIIYGC